MAPIGAALVWASAAHGASTSANVELNILEPFTIVKIADLQFGSMFATATAGTVIIDPVSGARTSTGGVTLAAGTFNPAEFATRGTPNRRVNVKLPNGALVLKHVGGGATMNVTNLKRNGAPPNSTPLDASGLLVFRVGGQLNVSANQLPGNYTGSFTVEIQYQ